VLGAPFDPAKAHALSHVPCADSAPGTQINEIKKPYYYKDRLLRVGEVVVAAAMPDATEKGSDSSVESTLDEAPGGQKNGESEPS
jgi:hypothetical protein